MVETEKAAVEAVPMQKAQDVMQAIGIVTEAQIVERIRMLDTLIRHCLCRTQPYDWIDFDGTPYLEGEGGARMAVVLGCDYPRSVFDVTKKDNGHFFVECYTDIVLGGRSVSGMGDCSSDEKFFTRMYPTGKLDGTGKEIKEKRGPQPHEVNIMDLKKKAEQNALTRAVTTFLGIRGLSWGDLEKLTSGHITKEKADAVKFKRGSHGGSADTKQAQAETVASENAALEKYQTAMKKLEDALTTALSWGATEEQFAQAAGEYKGRKVESLAALKKLCADPFEARKDARPAEFIAAKAQAFAEKIKDENGK